MKQVRAGKAPSRFFRSALVLPAFTLLVFSSCATERKPATEGLSVVQATPAEQTPQNTAKLAPPDIKSVEQAVQRVFKDAVVVERDLKPAFIAGDFNGDLSEDIAIILKPVPEKVADLNADYPSWILRNPFGSPEARAPRLRIAANELLLAIIHGHGANGWHDPEATQTFLLKDAVGSTIGAEPIKEFTEKHQGRLLPRLRGDLIGETIAGKSGYLYFNGGSYAWYDPRTFTGEPVARRSHGEQRLKN